MQPTIIPRIPRGDVKPQWCVHERTLAPRRVLTMIKAEHGRPPDYPG
ncbi:hypothetical protein [Azospirillum argentinense]